MCSTGKQEDLTQKVLEFQSTGEGHDKVYEECALAAFVFIRQYRRIDEDMKSEFFLHFHPTLVRTISQFRHTGISYQDYLKYLIRRRLKTFMGIQKRKSFLAGLAMFPGLAEHEQPDSSQTRAKADNLACRILAVNGNGSFRDRAARNRFLCYAFKRAYHHEEEDVGFIARITGTDPAWVREKVLDLKIGLSGQEERLSSLTCRRNRLFVEVRGIEQALTQENDRETRSKLHMRLSRKNRALSNLMTAIAHVQLSPSHLAIGKALGIPKGTVDVMLFRLRKRLALAKVGEKQYA